MSILDKVIQEMGGYGDMGLPDNSAENNINNAHVCKAYRLSDVLRHRVQSEEEESYDDCTDIEEIKQFFVENPEPSDEDVEMFAEEHGLDMQTMRKLVYSLIAELLNVNDSMDDDVASDNDEIDFDDEIDFQSKI